jgi:hypothetical protein
MRKKQQPKKVFPAITLEKKQRKQLTVSGEVWQKENQTDLMNFPLRRMKK